MGGLFALLSDEICAKIIELPLCKLPRGAQDNEKNTAGFLKKQLSVMQHLCALYLVFRGIKQAGDRHFIL